MRDREGSGQDPGNSSKLARAEPSANQVRLVPYDPGWANHFNAERRRLLALPNCPFRALEHIGSTAVPGLDAKPIVDMMASVEHLEEIEGFRGVLSTLGYTNLDGGFQSRRSFARPALAIIDGYHLHVVTEDVWPHKDERLFRDWLRAHQDVAQQYSALKFALAAKHPDSVTDYTTAKSDFIRTTINAARRAKGLPDRSDWAE